MVGGVDQVLDIRGKIRVLEFSLRGPEPCEIEPQDCNTERGKLRSNVTSCNDVFRTSEAMSEQRVSADTPRRQVQTRCQLITETASEGRADCTRVHHALQKISARCPLCGPKRQQLRAADAPWLILYADRRGGSPRNR